MVVNRRSQEDTDSLLCCHIPRVPVEFYSCGAGFTIIELMVATVLVGILMIFTMQIFTVNNRAYVKTDSVVQTQQSSRVIASTLESDLRHAGMMVPEGAAVCGVDNDTGPDRIYISDYTATNPAGSTGTFDGIGIQNAITNVYTGSNTFALDSLMIEPGTPDPSYDTDDNGTNDSDFLEGGGVIVVDLLDLDRGSACRCLRCDKRPGTSHRFGLGYPQRCNNLFNDQADGSSLRHSA